MRRAREQRVMLLFDLDRRCSVEYGMAELLCGCKLLLNQILELAWGDGHEDAANH
jgi:hypothetical protein